MAIAGEKIYVKLLSTTMLKILKTIDHQPNITAYDESLYTYLSSKLINTSNK